MTEVSTNKTVFVGLSGGVDSSVAAARLLEQGYTVVGVFIKVWHPDFMVCNWEAERLDAMRVAAHLGIPFLTCDAEEAYKNEVADYFISEYKAGRTPNPDVMCNQYVKFGSFLEFAKRHGANFIATGHYAQRIDKDSCAELHRGLDQNKDQTYFLWTLTDEQLRDTIFPIGDTPKENIRQEAGKLGIPVASKKDSQGICFLGQVDIPEFLGHYIDLQPGKILNTQGKEIGVHKGALVYTLGQRHGFVITTDDQTRKPYFVMEKDIESNVLVVDTEVRDIAQTEHITLHNPILRTEISANDKIEMQIRYRQTPTRVKVLNADSKEVTLEPIDPVERPAAGQSCVLYKGTLCVGGGIVA